MMFMMIMMRRGGGGKVLMETSRSPSSLHKFTALQDDILVILSVSRAKPYYCVNKLIATSVCINCKISGLILASKCWYEMDLNLKLISQEQVICAIFLSAQRHRNLNFPSLQFGKMFPEERNKEIPISLPFLFRDGSTENIDFFPFNLDECFQRMEPAVFVLHRAISWSGFPFQESFAFLLRKFFSSPFGLCCGCAWDF